MLSNCSDNPVDNNIAVCVLNWALLNPQNVPDKHYRTEWWSTPKMIGSEVCRGTESMGYLHVVSMFLNGTILQIIPHVHAEQPTRLGIPFLCATRFQHIPGCLTCNTPPSATDGFSRYFFKKSFVYFTETSSSPLNNRLPNIVCTFIMSMWHPFESRFLQKQLFSFPSKFYNG